MRINGYIVTLDNSHYYYNGRDVGQHAARVEKQYSKGKFVSWHNTLTGAIGMVRMMND